MEPDFIRFTEKNGCMLTGLKTLFTFRLLPEKKGKIMNKGETMKMAIFEDGYDRYVLESYVIDDEGYRIGLMRITFSSSPENALGKAHEIHSAMRS